MRFLFLFGVVIATTLHGQSNYPPQMEDARVETYKTIGETELNLWVFDPVDHKPEQSRPAIVFFFGGGWKKGSPAQFEQHCRYLASRGMVAITADYRVRERHQTMADRCVADAKSAIRYVRKNASRLGIDPQRIVAGGGSAGGHLAACTALIEGFEESDEDLAVASTPSALALFNPAVLLAPYDGLSLSPEKIEDIATRTGVDPVKISPIHHLREGLPPTIIFHGTADDAVPFETIRKYTAGATKLGNRVQLEAFPHAGHGFFNFGRGGTPGENYLRTVDQLDRFLVSVGCLQGESTVALPESKNVHLRSSFDHSRHVFASTGKGNVAFIGGSITEMNGYRPMVCEFLQEQFPDCEFTFTNAGISSTCSTTGAFRLQSDVLAHNPDLLFVEFAVNDDQDAGHAARECRRGMEGILRQARMHNPQMDIVVTHFVNPSMRDKLQRGETPVSSGQHESVAAHYGVSTSDLAREVAEQISAGSLTWATFGGTHPKTPGNRLAANMIADLLAAAWKDSIDPASPPSPHSLPRVLDQGSYFRGRYVDLDKAKIDQGWSIQVPDWKSIKGQCRSRFVAESLLCATEPGAMLTWNAKGTAFGAFVLAGPDAGTLECSIDGGPFEQVELFHRFSHSLHYPRTVMFKADLENRDHEIRLRVSKTRHASNSGNAVRVLHWVAN